MVDVLDMLGPMMPRRPTGGTPLPVPHPASGAAPDLTQILAEAASQMAPSDRRVVNNPTVQGVDPQALADAVLMFITNHGGHGSFPGLTRALIDNLAKAHHSALDIEAGVNPTAARMLLQGDQNPSMMSLMALDNPEAPKLSSFYGPNNPSENPEATIAASNELSRRLQAIAPQAQGGQADAVSGLMAQVTDLGPEDLAAADRTTGDGLDNIYNLNNNLRMLALAQQRGGVAGAQAINGVAGTLGQDYPGQLRTAILNAIEQSGVGMGRHNPLLDPASMRSLAPDMDPAALGYGMSADARSLGNEPPDLQLLMHLMGMTRSARKTGV